MQLQLWSSIFDLLISRRTTMTAPRRLISRVVSSPAWLHGRKLCQKLLLWKRLAGRRSKLKRAWSSRPAKCSSKNMLQAPACHRLSADRCRSISLAPKQAIRQEFRGLADMEKRVYTDPCVCHDGTINWGACWAKGKTAALLQFIVHHRKSIFYSSRLRSWQLPGLRPPRTCCQTIQPFHTSMQMGPASSAFPNKIGWFGTLKFRVDHVFLLNRPFWGYILCSDTTIPDCESYIYIYISDYNPVIPISCW